MQLVRIGNADSRKEHKKVFADPFNDYTRENTVLLDFTHFGNGIERTSDFLVRARWSDVQTLLGEFVKMGHAEAVKLQNAVKLAEGIESLGWTPPDPQPQN